MNINNITSPETQGSFIEAGYQKVSKNRFREQQNSGQYSTKISHTFCRHSEDGKAYKISEKRFKKLESRGADVFIKNKYFSKKIDEQQPDKEPQELSANSPLGTLQILPAELIAYTFGFLSPCKLHEVKTVSTQFCKIAVDQISLQPEYEIACKNLEFARPHFLIPDINDDETIAPHRIMALYLDSKGNLQAYQGNQTTALLYGKEPHSPHFKLKEEDFDKMNNITEELHVLSLCWKLEIKRENRKFNKYLLGVYGRKPFVNNEVLDKVAQHMIILANKLYDGSKEIAKNEAIKAITMSDDRYVYAWERVIEDSKTYSIDQLLEASKGVKHLALEPRQKNTHKG